MISSVFPFLFICSDHHAWRYLHRAGKHWWKTFHCAKCEESLLICLIVLGVFSFKVRAVWGGQDLSAVLLHPALQRVHRPLLCVGRRPSRRRPAGPAGMEVTLGQLLHSSVQHAVGPVMSDLCQVMSLIFRGFTGPNLQSCYELQIL